MVVRRRMRHVRHGAADVVDGADVEHRQLGREEREPAADQR